MKKILTIAAVGLLMPLFGVELNLQDSKLIGEFGKRILKQNINLYDQDNLGEWALRTYNYDKYNRTRNDEFEYDDAKQSALKDFKAHLQDNRL